MAGIARGYSVYAGEVLGDAHLRQEQQAHGADAGDHGHSELSVEHHHGLELCET